MSRTNNTIYDMQKSDLEARLIGRKVVSIVGETMELDDGTVLEFEDTGACCAWFSASLELIDLDDNAITAVTEVEREADAPEAWSLHILSRHKLIAKVNIEGDSTSGYYCHSINLNVKTVPADAQ